MTSTSVQPSLIFLMYLSSPTWSAPAFLASSSLSAEQSASTLIVFPVP